jgi:biopolymer transport protein ExbB
MDIVTTFVDFALLGAEWVLWLLVALSVLSIGVMIDRFLWMRGRDIDAETFVVALRKAWRQGEIDDFVAQHRSSAAIPIRVALAGLTERAHGAEAAAEAMQSERLRWRKEAEKNVVILGTLGNNTPFIGLFGTVLGIIGALDELQRNAGAGDIEVMKELSRALVATAVGLLVALPAVVAYNYFNRRIKVVMSSSDVCAHAVLGLVHASEKEVG